MLLVADAIAMGTMVDSVLLVVNAQKIRRDTVTRGVHNLQLPSSNLLGVVLNKVSTRRHGGYYYYYEYYSEDGGRRQRKRPRRFKPLAKLLKRGEKAQGRVGSK